MRLPRRAEGSAALLALLASACVSTTTTSRTWDGASVPPEQRGQVTWIRETVQHQEGNPAGGAAVGAIVGGLFGNAITGRPGGMLMGAIGGAAVGASASEGSAERRTYEVAVRFDDGAQQVFLFPDFCPFRVGEDVTWTSRGLMRAADVAVTGPQPGPGTSPPPPPYPPPPGAPPPPPPPR